MNLTYVTNIPQLCPVKKVLRAVFTTAFQLDWPFDGFYL